MFRNGQKVKCIDAVGAPALTLNGIYTVRYIDGPYKARFRGVIMETVAVFLYEAEPDPKFWGFHPSRFKPFDDRETDISVFKEILRIEIETDKGKWIIAPDGTRFRWIKVDEDA
jgi:hypothetical protein